MNDKIFKILSLRVATAILLFLLSGAWSHKIIFSLSMAGRVGLQSLVLDIV